MTHAKRLSIEIAVVALVAAIGAGAWWWCARQAERAGAELAGEYQARLATAERNCELWAAALGAKQAEAVLRSFAAGVYPALLGEAAAAGDLDVAVGALLELEGVEFVHLLAPDGAVLGSSDRKFTVLGAVPERAAWALGATELASRRGDDPGTLELAAPLLSTAGTEAILWLGFAADEVVESCRPEAIGVAGAPGGEATEDRADAS